MQTGNVKCLVGFVAGILLYGFMLFPVHAAFTSFYAFGDGVCTTTNGPGGSSYYGNRRTNGRVWIEVLAQWQGLTYDSNKNWSFYGHYSPNLVTNVSLFTPPPDANTALFTVWICNADFVEFMGRIYPSTNLVQWTTNINLSLTNHFKAITNLYAKGTRTLILPNAVDVTKVPQYNLQTSSADKNFIRQRVIYFNTNFSTTWLNQVQAACPDL